MMLIAQEWAKKKSFWYVQSSKLKLFNFWIWDTPKSVTVQGSADQIDIGLTVAIPWGPKRRKNF